MAQQLAIRHRFGGGWATDFGPSADIQLSGGQLGELQLVIPFLLQADNAFYELDGGPHKEFGTTELNSSALESGARIRGLYDYWILGTAGTSAQHRIVAVDDAIYKDDADGSFTSLFTGLSATAVPNFGQLDDILIVANDSTLDVPRSWDGSTAQNLAGTPPNFSFGVPHQGYYFVAGIAATPSKLHWPVRLDPEDWVGSGSGDITVDPQDGDQITGFVSYKQNLIVFKGPNKGSIHLITGTSNSDFAHVTLQHGIGAVWQNSIVRFGDDVAFLWSDGHIYSLLATDRFGDFAEGRTALTVGIGKWIKEHVNLNRLRYAWGANWPSRGIMLFGLPIDSSQFPNFILMIDYRFDPPRLAPWPDFSSFNSLAFVVDSSSKERIIMGGGDDGKVYRLGQPTRSLNGVSAISYNVRTPFMHYGNPMIMKTLQSASISVAPHNNSTIELEWTRDDNTPQAVNVSQEAGAVLDEFELNLDTLGGALYLDRFVDIENGGQFRAIQYRLNESENLVDVEIHSFSAVLEIDGPSWEN